MQAAARRRMDSVGGSHSGKAGFSMYKENVNATIAYIRKERWGNTMIMSGHKAQSQRGETHLRTGTDDHAFYPQPDEGQKRAKRLHDVGIVSP